MKYAIVLLVLGLLHCGAPIPPGEPFTPFPDDCEVMTEKVRVQLCPKQPWGVTCLDVSSTNPDPPYCAGPDFTEGKQETGNAWCCNW